MTKPRLSVGLYPTAPIAQIVELAQVLDESPCDTVWLGDSHLIWRECWSTIAACVGATTRLRLAPCVTNPLSRHPSITASTVATLQEFSGGRIRLGMSVGDSALRMTLGRVATLAELRAGYGVIRDLLESGSTTYDDRSLQLALTAPGTEIYLSGSGPRTMSLAAELGDGVIIVPGIDPQRIAQANAALAPGEARRRPEYSAPRRMLWVACSIRDDPSDAIADVRPFVASVLRHPLAFDVSEELEHIRTAIRENYEFGHHMARSAEHAEVVPDHVVKQFAVAGTEEEVMSQISQLRTDARPLIDEIALVLMAPDRMDTVQRLRRLI